MAEFRFTNNHTTAEVGNVIDILRRPRLYIPTERDYPDHSTWLEKVEAQLVGNKKRAMVAYMGNRPVGTVVYQRHESSPDILEVRNISVTPDAEGRYIGGFLLRNSEIEGIYSDFPGTNKVMVDTKLTNTGMILFLLNQGYELQKIVDLYSLGAGEDAVFIKPIFLQSDSN